MYEYYYKDQEKHKVFLSFYHFDDQFYRDKFEELFGSLFINKSVMTGDIASDNGDEYIKYLIQENYISDASVVVVLCGPNTMKRKHVDWEISAGLNYKVGNHHSGLVGILLPNHPDYMRGQYNTENIPLRLSDNVETGFAYIYDWTTDENIIRDIIQTAFDGKENEKLINNSRLQMQYNRL